MRTKRPRRSNDRIRNPANELWRVLGTPPKGTLTPSVLNALPRTKLLEACRILGLSGVSRLRKTDLVRRLLGVLRAREGAKPSEKAQPTFKRPPDRGTVPAPAPEPAPPAHAARSRAEFQAHKFALMEEGTASGEEAREPSLPEFIPWGYGRDRVRALAVDPERLYVYWEVTDEGRERARAKLGAGAATAWLGLRVYDTTGRLFDGTNAHSYFDHRIENGDRQWFFDIGKPGSEAFVEIGMKSHEGYFVRIARSGRVVLPRRSPAPYREPQWLTVRALAEPPAVAERLPATDVERAGRPPVSVVEPARASQHVPPPIELSLSSIPQEHAVEVREERVNESRWEAPVVMHFWEGGPLSVPVDVPEPSWETYALEATTVEVDGRTHVVFGPWQVAIRGTGAFEKRLLFSRWMVYRSFAVASGAEAPSDAAAARMLGSSARLGASELLYRAASERLLRGASERRYVSASEKLLRGASERRLGGASGRR